MAAETLERKIGHRATVERSPPENQNRDGWTRFQVTCEQRFESAVQKQLETLENEKVVIDGQRRDIEILHGADGYPISALGTQFIC